MRPNIPDDLVEDIDLLIQERHEIDPDALDFADKLRLVLPDTDQQRQAQRQEQALQQMPAVDLEVDPFRTSRR